MTSRLYRDEAIILRTYKLGEADRIIVREPGGSLSFLGGGQWADRLPRLIQARLLQSLENTGRLNALSFS